MKGNTPWDKAYKRSHKQKKTQERWDKGFELHSSNVKPAKKLHPDDEALRDARYLREMLQDMKLMQDELKEVWE